MITDWLDLYERNFANHTHKDDIHCRTKLRHKCSTTDKKLCADGFIKRFAESKVTPTPAKDPMTSFCQERVTQIAEKEKTCTLYLVSVSLYQLIMFH